MSKKKRKDGPIITDYKPRTFGSALAAFAGMIGISIVAGGLIASTTVPVLAVTAVSTDAIEKTFDDLPVELEIGPLMEKTNIYAKDSAGGDVLLATFFDQNREEVSWDSVNGFVKDALVAGEDPRYYEHGAIDLQGTGRALLNNLTGGSKQGGSSISQQYVKNVLIQKAEAITDEAERQKAYEKAIDDTFNRKLKEMKYAIGLEKKYTKEEILLGYLNIVGFGDRIYGIQAAARYYFNTTANDLSLSQAATLIAIVNNPNNLRIDQADDEINGAANGYERTLGRRNYVLDAMLEHKKISQEQHDAAVAEPITPTITGTKTGCEISGNAGYFCDYVTWVIKNDPVFGDSPEERAATLRRGGMQIYTTLDMDMQNASVNAIDAYVPKAMNSANIGSAAVSVQPGTGRILSMAQNKNYSADPDVLAQGPEWTSVNYNTDYEYGGSSGFQPGSTYKVFTLLEWLNTGHRLSETVAGNKSYSSFTNTCPEWGGTWDGSYTVNNDEGGNGGPITPLQSTVGSVNTGFMSMAQKLDLCGIKNMAEKFGVHRADGDILQSNPTAVLGTNEVSGLAMANAFAGIAAGGVVCNPVAIDRITDSTGAELPIPAADCKQVIDPGVAGAAASALQQVMASGTGQPSNLKDGVPVLGKTGTTDNAISTWMTGATTKVATAVWVGNVSGEVSMRALSVKGRQAATLRHLIWPTIMRTADAKYGGDAFAAANPNLR